MSTLRDQMLQVMQQKNYSPRTIKSYLSCLTQLSRHYGKSPELLSVQQINDFLHHSVTDKGLSNSLINQTIGALRVLFVNVLKREWQMLDFPRPRPEIHLPSVLSKEEIARLIQVTRNLKHRTIIMLAYSAGLRLNEVLSLKPADIDSQRMQIIIRQGKGHKDRTVILSMQILHQLRAYWKAYKPLVYLFEGERPSQPYSQRSVQYLLKRSVRLAGITKSVSFHTLRHSFATHLVEDGVDVIIIQRLLGHRSLRTTTVYLHLQNYDINKIKSPLDTLNTY
jgi:site-specific recombinase XerD